MIDEGTDNQTDERETIELPAESEVSNQESEKVADAVEAKDQEAPDNESDPDEANAEGEDKPKRRSGYDRMKRRAMIAEAKALELEHKLSTTPAKAEASPAPKLDDFNGDYDAYQQAVTAYTVRNELRALREEELKAERERRAVDAKQEVVSDFEERAADTRSRIKDFDAVIETFAKSGGQFSPDVRDLLMDSEKGPDLVYFLAKNPSIANKLNSLSPISAAKEIGAIEARLSNQNQRTTQASKPITPLTGGAKPTFDPRKSTMEEYAARRAAGWKG